MKTVERAKLGEHGSVKMACEMLDDCDRHTIYHLLAAGLVKGFKQQPDRKNSHWRIDLQSVWEYKQRQLG
ncbi:MAG: hypothetical protein ABJQ29_11410 [Luteolibacter sp.]